MRACAEAGVPLVAFRRSVRFVEITEAVHAAVLNSQFELLRRGEEIHRRFTELILHGRGVPEILAELAAAVGNPVVLEDAGHELVYYVSGRAGDDVALSAWADLHRAEDRGETPEGALLVDVRLMDSSWGRLIALAVDEPLDDFDRVAASGRRWRWRSTCSASSTRSTCARARAARSCPTSPTGAWRRPTPGGAPRRSASRARRPRRAAAGGGELARAALAPWRRAVVDAAVGRAAGGAVLDRLRGPARPARRRPAGAARARRAFVRRGAGRARRRALPRRARAARRRGRRRRRWRSARRPTPGWPPAPACAACAARRAPRPRCRRAAGTTRGARA